MTSSRFRLAIFDLDGTLVDSVPDIAVALNAALADMNLAGVSIEQVRGWVGNGAHVLVRRALSRDLDASAAAQDIENLYQRFLARYSERVCEQSRVYAGVVDCLEYFRAAGCMLVCVTNKPVALANALLEALELDQWFSHLLGGDSMPEKKPDPAPLLHVMEQLQVGAAETVMIGDSHSDIAAARAAGIESVCVSYGYHQDQDVRALGATHVVDSLAELPSLLSGQVQRA